MAQTHKQRRSARTVDAQAEKLFNMLAGLEPNEGKIKAAVSHLLKAPHAPIGTKPRSQRRTCVLARRAASKAGRKANR